MDIKNIAVNVFFTLLALGAVGGFVFVAILRAGFGKPGTTPYSDDLENSNV
jgi:hypothetical protein